MNGNKNNRAFSRRPNGRRNGRRNGTREETMVHRTPIVSLPKTVYGFPPRLRTKLRYASLEIIQLVSTTGSLAKQFYSCNSIYDPDRTNAGHQPLYHDTYASIYNHYAVINSTITTRFINSGAALIYDIGIGIEDNATSTTTVNTAAEMSFSEMDVLGIAASSRSVVTLTKSFNAAAILNIDPFSSEEYKTPVGSDPTEESFFVVWGNEIGGGTGAVSIQSIIEYDVLFSELSTPVQS